VEEKLMQKRILESSIVGNRPVGKTRESWVNAVGHRQ
jgi:hypothetical protein